MKERREEGRPVEPTENFMITLRQDRIIDILLTTALNELDIVNLLTAGDLSFPSNLFVTLILVRNEADSKNPSSGGDGDSAGFYEGYHELEAYISQVFSDLAVVHFSRKDKNTVCLLNLYPEERPDNAALRREIRIRAEKIIAFHAERYHSALSIAMSRIHIGIDKINLTHREAVAVESWITILGVSDRLAAIDDFSGKRIGRIRHEDVESFLHALLEDYRYEKAEEELRKFVEAELTAPDLRVDAISEKFSEIKLAAGAILTDGAVLCGYDVVEVPDIVSTIIDCSTMQELIGVIHGFIDVLASTEGGAANLPPAWLARVVRYIGQNYTSPEVNLSHLSYVFGLNSELISHTFIKYKSMSVLRYIHTLRLEKAKELLLQNCSVSEAAEGSGCGSTRTLIRMFQKYEGINPSDYRRLSEGTS